MAYENREMNFYIKHIQLFTVILLLMKLSTKSFHLYLSKADMTLLILFLIQQTGTPRLYMQTKKYISPLLPRIHIQLTIVAFISVYSARQLSENVLKIIRSYLDETLCNKNPKVAEVSYRRN